MVNRDKRVTDDAAARPPNWWPRAYSRLRNVPFVVYNHATKHTGVGLICSVAYFDPSVLSHIHLFPTHHRLIQRKLGDRSPIRIPVWLQTPLRRPLLRPHRSVRTGPGFPPRLRNRPRCVIPVPSHPSRSSHAPLQTSPLTVASSCIHDRNTLSSGDGSYSTPSTPSQRSPSSRPTSPSSSVPRSPCASSSPGSRSTPACSLPAPTCSFSSLCATPWTESRSGSSRFSSQRWCASLTLAESWQTLTDARRQVLITLICMAVIISKAGVHWGDAFDGFVPSKALVTSQGLYNGTSSSRTTSHR